VTAEACRAAPAPQPSIFGAPSSATFNGQGNVVPPATGTVKKVPKKAAKCPRGKVRNKKGRCVRKPKPKKRQRK
jgi:hypothetical protein